MIDLTQEELPPGQQLAARGKWPIIGEREPADSAKPWLLSLSGLIQKPFSLTPAELKLLPQTSLLMDIHCVTRWSRTKVNFTGVLLEHLIEKTVPNLEAAFVSFVSRSDRKHSASLPISVARELKTLIAFEVDGQPLPIEHGGPIRNIVPGRYFYKSVKWLEEIEFLPEDRLGFWEAESGYHNNADYWREERYMAPTIDRRMAVKLIESRDFSGKNLRSIDAANRNLSKLSAVGSLLRDANFNKSDLREANFTDAILSNASLENCDLRGANFMRADLEGANFSGSDLRGAILDSCSLIGASFFERGPNGTISAARFDETTVIADAALQPLSHDQLDFVKSKINRHRPG